LKYWTPEYTGGTFLYGLSPIRAGRRVVTKSNASYDTMVSAFQNQGAQGMITGEANAGEQSLTPEQAEMLKQRYQREYSGPKNKGKPIITSAALKWQQMGMSPADLAIIESDKMDLRTICNIFHVPSELFNDASNKTYSNTKEAGSAIYTNAVIPALTAFRDAINQFIRSKYQEKIYIDFDTSMISELQDDLTLMTAALSGAWWLTPNERRSMMSFDEVENPMMDDYWTPSGLMPMSGSQVTDTQVADALNNNEE
jgi:HK97 family phage portal protein